MKKIVQSFKEHKEFPKDKPWSAVRIDYTKEDMTPPHYADTIEMLVYDNVLGDAYIGAKHFAIEGKMAYFIAPGVVHGFKYKKCHGHVMTLKINVAQLKPIFDIEAFLSHNHSDYTKLPMVIDDVEKMSHVAKVFAESENLGDIIHQAVDVLELLMSYSRNNDGTFGTDYSENEEMLPIIDWTENNFNHRITLDDAASHLGYTKEHFCRKFKDSTGITYLTYLNSTRIIHACKLLKSGCSVSETALMCGFDDVSYFIRLFKKIKGVTPKKYSSEK